MSSILLTQPAFAEVCAADCYAAFSSYCVIGNLQKLGIFVRLFSDLDYHFSPLLEYFNKNFLLLQWNPYCGISLWSSFPFSFCFSQIPARDRSNWSVFFLLVAIGLIMDLDKKRNQTNAINNRDKWIIPLKQ